MSKSLWMEIQLPTFPSLESDIKTDVCIVGAGIAGLTCAYTLAKAGKAVVVVDQSNIAQGQTGYTTAHLTWALDDRYFNLESFFGEEGAKIAAQSHAQSIDYIEKIVRDEQIDCDFERVDGYLFRAPEDEKNILDKEFEAIKKTGMPIEKVPNSPINTFNTGPCLRFPHQAQFHPLKYIKGLVAAIEKYGGKIHTNTHVAEFKDGDTCTVKTKSGFTIECQAVIVATCTPINNRFFIHTKQAAYRTYAFAGRIPKGSFPKGLYWDTPDPYHYMRIQNANPNEDWLIIGGEDHRTGQGKEEGESYIHLEKWARERFPQITNIDYHWSGQVFEPVDSLAFIGKNPHDKNTYVITGDSGNGLTHATIAGLLIPDLILGKTNPWSELYNPSRKTLSAAKDYMEENFNTFWQYTDWLTSGELEEVDNLPAEEGKILREGVKKIAVYKDSDNQLHLCSAFCPHLGGCVHWNSEEKSWDCPCHGSRFDKFGKVLVGPALDDLKPLHSDALAK